MNQEDQLITNRLSAWWKSLPIFSLLLFTLILISSVLSLQILFEVEFVSYLTYDPYHILESKFVYTVLTYPFICFGIPQAFILIYCYQSFSVPKEKSIGTFRFTFYFLVQQLVIAIFFIPISYFAGLNQIYSTPSIRVYLAGLWPALMAELIIDSYKESNKDVDFLCFTCKIKNKYYTLILFVIFSMIAGTIFMLIAGVLTGFTYAFGLLNWTQISESCAEKIERKVCCCFFKLNRFVSTAESEFEMQNTPLPQSRTSSPPFSGQGFRLG